jgi:aspartyl-tRNA(Asn)/glutamyl-tRNA(Gln) amidotransferase subunit A
MADELAYLGIAEVATQLSRGTLSPVELCRALLARAERLQPLVNAFITLSPDRVLAQAQQAERELARKEVRGPLHGVPIAVKDNCWTKGERTTAGSRVLADFVPGEDATVVARLRAAGAIIFGKTNLPEFAYGPLDAYHYGPSRNPWNLERFAGGSSMGAGAALAAGLVPGALGSDTGGSIRNPCHWSGVTGLKPTYGRVPLRGVVPLATSLDHVGPMARSAQDCALLLDVIAGHDTEDPTSADVGVPGYTGALLQPTRGMRVGVLRGELWKHLPGDMAKALEQALRALSSLRVELVDVEVAAWEPAAAVSQLLIRCEAAADYRQVLKERPGDLIPQVRERLEAGLATPAPDYVEAQRAGARLRAELRQLFTRIDVLALPGRERTAPRIDAGGRHLDPLGGPRYTAPLNIAGLPVLTLPCGFDDQELPLGIQLAGRAWEEGRTLAVGHAFQRVTDWHTRRPKLG